MLTTGQLRVRDAIGGESGWIVTLISIDSNFWFLAKIRIKLNLKRYAANSQQPIANSQQPKCVPLCLVIGFWVLPCQLKVGDTCSE